MNSGVSDTLPLLGVVLCGGRSSRMGQDKASLNHPHGGTFLSFALNRLQEICNQVVVSGGSSGSTGTTLPDPLNFQGPATGIATSLSYAQQQALAGCLVTPIDMPQLAAKDLRKLVSIWQQQHQLTCAITSDGRIQPLVAIYPVELAAHLQELATSTDRSLSRWIDAQPHATIQLSQSASRNINCREDLRDSIDQ